MLLTASIRKVAFALLITAALLPACATHDAGKRTSADATLNAAPFYARQGFRPVGRGEFGGRGAGFPPIAVVIMEEGA